MKREILSGLAQHLVGMGLGFYGLLFDDHGSRLTGLIERRTAVTRLRSVMSGKPVPRPSNRYGIEEVHP